MGSNDQRGGRSRSRQGGGRIGQRSGHSSGQGQDSHGRGNECKTFAKALILLTLTGISLRTSGNALGLCAHMSCSYKMAAVMAAEEATRVTNGLTQIEPPAVYLQYIQTLTIPLTQQMCRPTSWLCPKSQSKDPRTVAVLAVAPTIPDSWRTVRT
jgi:hypothetical protein